MRNPQLFMPMSARSLLSGLGASYSLQDNLLDSGPNGLALINNNNAGFTDGKVGRCVHLVAASNQYLSHASDVNYQASASQSLTVSCWVQHTTLQAVAGAVNKGSPTSGTGGEWGLEFIGPATNKWRLTMRNATDTSSAAATSAVVCTTATWYHVLGWWDAVGKTLNISVNGETPVTTSFAAGGFAGTNDLNVGYWVAGGARFNGDIDAVGIWPRVLTSGERAILYNNGNGREYPY